jgi:hypothetical protein
MLLALKIGSGIVVQSISGADPVMMPDPRFPS